MSRSKPTKIRMPFRPRARLLQLLGDELIGSARLAVFELVKNAYDADANEATVTLDLRPGTGPSISVLDDGEGMSPDLIQKVWLVPGDDHRQRQRSSLVRSPLHLRLPLGEKGLGRFAVHKLGNRIELVTRSENCDECVVVIDWNKLIRKPFLEDAPVTIQIRRPQVFNGRSTGTHIRISELREATWTRRDVRRLQRQITSICSPFSEPGGFQATLEVPGHEHWITDLPDVKEVLARALWKFSFSLNQGVFDWKYQFRKVPGLQLAGRVIKKDGDKLRLPPVFGDDGMEKKVVADASTTKGIGPVTGDLYVYDRDREVLRRLTDVNFMSEYLDENGGVRVYRDGIRVYNYGEPGDDWLGLDLRRVNAPTRGISRNIIIGAVHLSLENSKELVEKTNREGFVENDACSRLRRVVLGALATLESERQNDKERIRTLTASGVEPAMKPIQKPIEELRKALDKTGSRASLEPYVARIESGYRNMQETLLSAGMAGLNLAVIFHEVERGVRALYQVIVDGRDISAATVQARELMHLLDGFSTLLRRDNRSKHTARRLIETARQFNVLRLRHHRVRLVCPLLESSHAGFEANFAFGLVLGALNNLIDNSLYWLRVRWAELPTKGSDSPRALYLNVTDALEGGPAIVLADTGPGFQDDDDPERLVRPFFTRKPTGMGLGLYYANLAMELNGGQLVFPHRSEVDLPAEFDGAVTALIFKAPE